MARGFISPETYKGVKITFSRSDDLVWARASSISKQFLGAGSTKEKAFNEAKKNLNGILKVRKKRRGRKKK